jgi:outer membrane protein TolC
VIEAGPAFREAPDSVPIATADTVSTADSVAPAAPAPAAASRIAFWETLGDTTLSRLVAEGLAANHDIRAAEARVRGARAARRSTAFDLAPTITVEGGYTASGWPAPASRVWAFPDQDLWDVGRWRPGSWTPAGCAGTQGQNALLGSAREDLRDVQILLTAEPGWRLLRPARRPDQLAVAQRNAENQRRSLEVTQQRLDAGRGTAFDTERARAQLSSTLAAIPSLEARVAGAQYRIGVLVGRPPAAVAGELEAAGPMPAPPEVGQVVSPDSLVRLRPDVVAAERRLAAETAFVGAATADYLPRITLSGQAGYTAPELDAIGNTGTSRYAVGPVISWPALNLGRVKARADAAKARQAEARARYEQAVLFALRDVETSLVYRVEEPAGAARRGGGSQQRAEPRPACGSRRWLTSSRCSTPGTQLEAQDQL